MTRVLRYFLLLVLLFVGAGIVMSQEESSIRGIHKVKRKETIFGISRMYEITIEELIDANPVMKTPGYELKKGDELRIPFSKKTGVTSQTGQVIQSSPVSDASTSNATSSDDVRNRTIRLGVMLPLHDINGDGKISSLDYVKVKNYIMKG